MRILVILTISLVSLMNLSLAQSSLLAVNQQWNVYFEDAQGWTVNLLAAQEAGFTATAKSPSLGATLESAITVLNDEDKTFLGLAGDYMGVFIVYPAGMADANGADVLLCSLPTTDFSTGQAFGLSQRSTGLEIVYAGQGCSASQLTADASTATGWPPQVQTGDTWEVKVTQNQSELASWTVSFTSENAGTLTGSAVGTDNRQAEGQYITENPPAPSMLNTWVFALNDGSQPLFCIFSQEKPYTASTMTGSVMMMGASCTATKLQ